MQRPDGELHKVYLQPGELFLAREPTIISTILGSCVGVTFWWQKTGAGALCHALLPKRPQAEPGTRDLAMDRRYVDSCIQELAQRFDQLGVPRAEVQVKIFGGADMFAVDPYSTRSSIGKLNREIAVEILGAEGFHVIASSVGSTFGRKIKFNTRTGDVFLKRLV